ncbi:hypothetical protein [Pseudoxanthomonas sp.]|uniref:hypothetical protein n=1 Tax=Pseudoxanthomonas sp. TaxID=1871049 RepID=UPI002583C737|nr:hypothetical protein [Pseudoxanthomonas sp.]MCR6687769.1 hypothetical protein [Pseudoxanthomonas sp.]
MSGRNRSILPRTAPLLVALLALAALAACRREPPPTEQPPEPQAQAHTELRDAIQAPQEQAKAAEGAVLQGADAQRAQIDAAEGG